ncbi:hypothetical protein, partial [Klebsiella aerogenes]|uniref:hypothetical protein n=1 Tax=Klebsiella aerogenes TaxID=548 RepID=UPI0019538FAA
LIRTVFDAALKEFYQFTLNAHPYSLVGESSNSFYADLSVTPDALTEKSLPNIPISTNYNVYKCFTIGSY